MLLTIGAVAAEVGRPDVRGWFEENWFGKAPLERLGVNFPNWMARRLYAMAGKEDALEYDASDLLKLFAPRKVLVLSANDAKWLGPGAEQAAAKQAGVLHWTRPGNHSMTADDWQEIFKVLGLIFNINVPGFSKDSI